LCHDPSTACRTRRGTPVGMTEWAMPQIAQAPAEYNKRVRLGRRLFFAEPVRNSFFRVSRRELN
jgi:hypothetical protein